MNSSYKLRATPVYVHHFGLNRFAQPSLPQLTTDSLAKAFVGAAVRQLIPYDTGAYDVEIDLQRQSHADALDEIVNAFVNAGFQVAEIQVTEWTTSWIEGAIAGAVGGTAIGSLFGTVAGFVLGGLIGTEVGIIGGMLQRRVIRTLDAVQNYYVQGGWQLTVRKPSVAPAITPRLAY